MLEYKIKSASRRVAARSGRALSRDESARGAQHAPPAARDQRDVRRRRHIGARCREVEHAGNGNAATASTAVSNTLLDPGAGLGEHEVKAILDYKKKHPSMESGQHQRSPAQHHDAAGTSVRDSARSPEQHKPSLRACAHASYVRSLLKVAPAFSHTMATWLTRQPLSPRRSWRVTARAVSGFCLAQMNTVDAALYLTLPAQKHSMR